jgi:hypothetical protein
MTNYNNWIGVSSYNGRVVVYERRVGTWYGVIVGANAPLSSVALNKVVTMRLVGNQVTLIIDGNSWTGTVSVLGSGRVGVISRDWLVPDGPFFRDFKIV